LLRLMIECSEFRAEIVRVLNRPVRCSVARGIARARDQDRVRELTPA
jgi:hypothetical protein